MESSAGQTGQNTSNGLFSVFFANSGSALLSRQASGDSMTSPTDSTSKRYAAATETTNGSVGAGNSTASSSNTHALFRFGSAKKGGDVSGQSPPQQTNPSSNTNHSNTSHPNGGGGGSDGARKAVSSANQCTPLMSGYRQCLEVNPDAKVNCTWALDKYMVCQEMHDNE